MSYCSYQKQQNQNNLKSLDMQWGKILILSTQTKQINEKGSDMFMFQIFLSQPANRIKHGL